MEYKTKDIIRETNLKSLGNVMKNLNLSLEQAMDAIGIPEAEKDFYRGKLSAGSKKQKYSSVGDDAMEFIDSLMTPEEIEKRNRWVARVGKRIKARQRRKRARAKLKWAIKNKFRRRRK